MSAKRESKQNAKRKSPRRAMHCQWNTLGEALAAVAGGSGQTESAAHIKPLHWYIASRLVIEGGFLPTDIMPSPPFRVEEVGKERVLHYDPSVAGKSERTILGGLKTKDVDVVVTKEGIGPVVAVSCKGVTGAYRNLTNRMEESVGECTNLHITYPAMVVGYFVIALGHKFGAKGLKPNDYAYTEAGTPMDGLTRFHYALSQLSGRKGIRNDVSRYEAVALAMVEPDGATVGTVQKDFPPDDSAIHLGLFFKTIYQRYEERFVFGAPKLRGVTMRYGWADDSPAFNAVGFDLSRFDYIPRAAVAERSEEELAEEAE